MAELSGQTECRLVTSSQCRSAAIFSSGVNQSPAIESPTRATVSTGCDVSPKAHSLGVGAATGTRQPCRQSPGRLMASGCGTTGAGLIVSVLSASLAASTAAPG